MTEYLFRPCVPDEWIITKRNGRRAKFDDLKIIIKAKDRKTAIEMFMRKFAIYEIVGSPATSEVIE